MGKRRYSLSMRRAAGWLLAAACLGGALSGCSTFSMTSRGSGNYTSVDTVRSRHVMIYEAYTAGGYRSGKYDAPVQQSYVVLYNPMLDDFDLTGYVISAVDGNTDQVVGYGVLSGVINAESFYTIAFGPCADAPQPPAGEPLGFAADCTIENLLTPRKSGKLVLSTADANGLMNIRLGEAYVVDFLGYGDEVNDINEGEGKAPVLGVGVNSLIRRRSVQDTDINADDFGLVNLRKYPQLRVLYDAGTKDADIQAAWREAENPDTPPLVSLSFSLPGGQYSEPQSVTLTATPGAKIYYTLDGNSPLGRDGRVRPEAWEYAGALTVVPMTAQYPELTQTAFEALNSNRQPSEYWPDRLPGETDEAHRARALKQFSENPQIMTIRAVAVNADGIPSAVETESYIILPKTIDEMFGDIPVLSMTTDVESLYDPQRGIFMPDNQETRGSDATRLAHLELFEPNGVQGFSRDVEIRLHGGYTRSFPQKSIRIDIPDGGLEYDLFAGTVRKQSDGYGLTQFDTFILRNGGNSWAYEAMRDNFYQTMCANYFGSFATQGYRPCVMFLNGEFWGIYDIREKYTDDYFADHYGIDPEDVVCIEGYSALAEGIWGDEQPLVQLRDFIWGNDMSVASNYKRFTDEVDKDEYIDYMIAEIYGGNTDWPHNNFYFWRNKNPDNGFDTQWHIYMADVDYTFHNSSGYDHDTLAYAMSEEAPNDSGKTLRALWENESFRQDFITRFRQLLDSTFVPSTMIARFNSMVARMDKAYAYQKIRWFLNPDLRTHGARVATEYMQARNAFMRGVLDRAEEAYK